MSRTPRRPWRPTRTRALPALLGLWLLVPLMLLALAPSASASGTAPTTCLPDEGVQGCITGIVGNRAEPIADVDVTLTPPQGEPETITTGEDGRFSFTITEGGRYLVSLDPDSLPEDRVSNPPPADVRGPDGELVITIPQQQFDNNPILRAANLEVRSVDFDATTSKTDELLQAGANGLQLGLLLALASVGLSLIYGTTGLSNFAHAEQVTLGGMVGYGLVNVAGINLWVGIVLTVLICAATGYFQDAVLWKPLRGRGLGLNQMMIVTIGLSLFVQYCFQFFVGASQVKVTIQTFDVLEVGPVRIGYLGLGSMALSLVVMALVGLILLRTRIGQATRAVSDNPSLASASGINVNRIIRLVWTLAMGLAGLAGVLYALVISNGIRWDTGLQILLLLFAAVTLGGLGTAFGAMIGSVIIGLVVELSGPLGAPGDLKYAVALAILILLLLVRPQGLLGRAERVG